jgi:outer membrane protein assembly factor BamB
VRGAMSLALTLVVVMVGACSGEDSSSDAASSDTTESADGSSTDDATERPAYDPPLAFADTPVNINNVRHGVYTVRDSVIYYVENPPYAESTDIELAAVDLATGDPLWSLPIEDDFTSSWGRPGVAEVDGETLVFATHGVVESGTGTATDREMLRVTAVDAADADTVWTADVDAADIPEDAREAVLGDSPGLPVEPAHVVAADGDNVVISTDDEAGGATFTVVVTANSGEARWNAAGFKALALGDGVVAGVAGVDDERRLVALSTSDGSEVWRADESFEPDTATVDALGSGLVAATGYVDTGGTHTEGEFTNIFTMSNGQVLSSLDTSHSCIDDTDSVIVCDSGSHVIALDVVSGDTLWELPDQAAERIAPAVDAALSGVVYGSTDNGPVILNARTGEDTVTALAITPDDVVPGFGLVIEDEIDLQAYPATE